MRWKVDEVDLWCFEWAVTRRKIHGIILVSEFEPKKHVIDSRLEPKERLGKLASTLGRIKEEAEGAATAGAVNQNWPDVYTGMGLLIHRGWFNLPNRCWQLTMDAHYVWKEIPVKDKAAVVGITPSTYWKQLDSLKTWLSGYVTQHRDTEDGTYRLPKSATFVRRYAT